MSGKFKTSGFVAATGCIFLLAVLTSARAADKTLWMKYNNALPGDTNTTSTDGRIPHGTTGQGDDTHAIFPAVIQDGSTYKMWYAGMTGGKWCIYYATSSNGLTWTKYTNAVPQDTSDTTNWGKGRIPLGKTGTGDKNGAYCPSVIKDDSIYKMWYQGKDSGSKGRIYYATSTNGLTWTKYSNSIPDASNTTGTYGRIPLGTSGGDTANIYGQCVIKDGPTYKMWYSGSDGTNYRIYHATSSNGLTWTKYTNAVPDASNTTGTYGRIPIGEAGKGDALDARFPTVIKHGSVYKMWYNGQVNSITGRVYYATSTDGLTWKKYDNSIPDDSNTTSTNGRVPLGQSGGDTVCVSTPCVIKDGYFYKMWYGGRLGGNFRIYHALLDQVPTGLIFYGH